MRFADYVAFAFRNTRRQKLRSALTVFAVLIGATSVTVMLSLVTSVKTFFVDQFESSGEIRHVVVSQQSDITYQDARNSGGPSNDGTRLTDDIASKIKTLPHVTQVARVVNPYQIAAIGFDGKKLQAQQVEGYDVNGVIKNTVVAGRDLSATDADGVVTLSQGYAEKFGLGAHPASLVGRTVDLVMQPGYSGAGATITQPPMQGPGDHPRGGDPRDQGPSTSLTAKVVGIVSSDDADYRVSLPIAWATAMMTQQRWEMNQAHMTLVTSSELDQRGYSSFVTQVDDAANAAAVAKQIKTFGVGAATAQSFIQDQLDIFNIIGYVLAAIGGIALVVATIGVINTMVMAVLERTREIGVIRACGGTRRAVRRLFTSEAALLGFLGGAGGVAVGYGLTLIANVMVNEQLSKQGVQSSDIIGVPAWLIASVIVATTVIGMLAGLGPAARAARLDPVAALRYE